MELIFLTTISDLDFIWDSILKADKTEEAHIFYLLVGGIYVAILLYCYLTAGNEEPPEDDSEKDDKNKESSVYSFGTTIKKKNKHSEINPEKSLITQAKIF